MIASLLAFGIICLIIWWFDKKDEKKVKKEVDVEMLKAANSFFKLNNCPHPRYATREKIIEFIRDERSKGNEDMLSNYYYYAKAIGYPIW